MTDVERNILGAIIEQPRAFDFFHGHLRVEDFEDPECARVWQHILSLHAGSLPISPRTVAEKAGADIATVLLRHELEYPSTPKQWRNWLQQHADDVARRQIATTARRLLDGAHTEPLQDLRAELDRLARGVNDRRARRAAPVRDVAERAINRMAAGDAESGLMTGYSRMDEFLNGLRGFIVVGADASMGKTAGLCNLFARLYTRGAKPGYLSCEDEDEPLVRRMMQAHGKFNWRAAASGNYGVTEENRIADRCREFKGHDGWILDGLSSATDICSEARRLVEREGCGCLMIDYLQLAEAEGNPRTEYEGITSVSKTFVRLQKELRVPVIVAAQLNRRREESGQLPGLHHLKGSGQIGQDADLVLLLYRETRAAEDMLMIVAKHRNGPTGTLHFRFDGHTQVIEEADPPSDEDGEPTRYPTTPRIDGPPSLTG